MLGLLCRKDDVLSRLLDLADVGRLSTAVLAVAVFDKDESL